MLIVMTTMRLNSPCDLSDSFKVFLYFSSAHGSFLGRWTQMEN